MTTMTCHCPVLIVVLCLSLVGSITAQEGDLPGQLIPLTFEEKLEIVDVHNSLRASVTPPATDMEYMEWSEAAALTAGIHAQSCVNAHDDPKVRTIPDSIYCGQNLVFLSWKASFSYAIRALHSEVVYYTYGIPGGKDTSGRTEFKTTGRYAIVDFAGSVRHYTQIVWNTTSSVGCGLAQCPGFYMYVCNYCPGGNYNRDVGWPYTAGPSATGCEKGVSSINDKLCNIPCPNMAYRMDHWWNCGDENAGCDRWAENCPRTCNYCPAASGGGTAN